MKKYLLPNDGNFYKANLHMHTTISDGNMTPEETKKAFLEKGYSIVAFTDHEVMVPHTDLSDDNFLAITSTEISMNIEVHAPFEYLKCYHLNLYSKDPLKDCFNTFTESKMWLEHSKKYITEEQRNIKYIKTYSVECVNDIIKKAKEEGCFVSYNHPVWSLQTYEDYIGLKGLWGVEWHNTGCVNAAYKDTFQPVEDLLRLGERVYPLATDDAHNIGDCFGGWVMVKCANLEYDTVYNALENGDFYSSNGPEILSLSIQDGVVSVNTSKVKAIQLNTERRITLFKNGVDLTEAQFDINFYLNECKNNINKNQYIRITVVDEKGNEAHSRAYFIDELL